MPGAAAAEEAKKDGGGEQRRSKAAAAHRGLEKFSVGSTCVPPLAFAVCAGCAEAAGRYVCRFSPGERGKSVAPPPASLPNTNIDVRPPPAPSALPPPAPHQSS